MITLGLVIRVYRKLEIFMHHHFEFGLVTGDFELYADWSSDNFQSLSDTKFESSPSDFHGMN